jgi:sugar phosphate isomerase/epimerase
MGDPRQDRRDFCRATAVSLAAAGFASPLLAVAKAGGDKSLRLGAPVFNAVEDPEELALAHRRLGYRAAYCPGIPLQDSQRIRDTERAFAKHDVVIAEVGRWVNLMDADAARRDANLKRVTEGLALAEAVNARCCVDIAGSMNPEIWYGPDPRNVSPQFFDAAVENARKIIDAVKPKRAKFGYEMMGWALPDSADSYLKMVHAVDRAGFAVHLDPCNLINSPRRFYQNTALINECFDKLGPHIVSCHAKDLYWKVEMNVHFQEVTLGEGQLDYRTYLKRLAALPADVPLMVEHMKGEREYNQSREHLFQIARELGIAWES